LVSLWLGVRFSWLLVHEAHVICLENLAVAVVEITRYSYETHLRGLFIQPT